MGRVMWNVASENRGKVRGGVLLGPVAVMKWSYKKLLFHLKIKLQG
jgi:hypothetical protein